MRADIKINKPIRIKRQHIGRMARRYNKRHLGEHLSAALERNFIFKPCSHLHLHLKPSPNISVITAGDIPIPTTNTVLLSLIFSFTLFCRNYTKIQSYTGYSDFIIGDVRNPRFALFTDESDARFALFTDEQPTKSSPHSSSRIFRKRFSFYKIDSKRPLFIIFYHFSPMGTAPLNLKERCSSSIKKNIFELRIFPLRNS